MSNGDDYFTATRHPWACLLFLLPLLGAYEGGVNYLGGPQADALRNGADVWVRYGLSKVGLRKPFWAPVVVGSLFVAWCYSRRQDRPRDLLGVVLGMALESVVFALLLWGLGQGLGHLMDRTPAGTVLAAHTATTATQVVTFLGAGIYEELLFRLGLFTALFVALRFLGAPNGVSVLFAALASAACFSAAHHLGPQGEPFAHATFCFRLVAGVYFAVLYHLRGFGIAAGAHACYDVLAGVHIG